MRIRIDLKIFIFLILFYFTNQLRIYLIVMFFCFMHEIAHMILGIIFKMKPNKLEINPFGFSISFNNESNKIKEVFVVLAGPVMNVGLAILCQYIKFRYITIEEAVYSNILIFLFNMLPIYPLDGGRIVKGLLHIKMGEIKAEEISNKISYITIILVTIFCSISVYYFQNFAIFLICIFLWRIVLKEKNGKTLAIL